MTQDWTVTVWGVRGAMPAVSLEYMEFGGNTSCVSVDCGENLVIFDTGTGLSALSRNLNLKRPIHIFTGHTHIDHLLGLYIFPAVHDPAAEIHFYGEPRAGRSFRQQMEEVIAAPYWPVGFQDPYYSPRDRTGSVHLPPRRQDMEFAHEGMEVIL